MKTLKKTFAVLLVLVTMLSIVPIVSASDFKDSDEIKYVEAVDVLAGIKVLEGFDDGNFKPKDNVRRSEAAAIITRLMLGRSLADALPDAPTGFKDCDGVSGVGFAIKYIRYCVSQGIIVGYPNGNFGPNDPVTASQFAVMLMRALGIGNTNRYVGDDWQMYAILDGMDSGILDEVADGVDFTKAANREETSQYAFNGLLYSPSGEEDQIYGIVNWDSNNKPVYGWVTVPAKAKDSVWGKTYKKLYRYNDHKVEDGRDDLGRPAVTWKYGDDKVTIHSKALTPVATFNASFTQRDLYKVVGEEMKITAVVNQPKTAANAGGRTTATLTSLKSDNKVSTDIFPDNNNDGRGVRTEIFEIADDEYAAIVIKPGFGEVSTKDTKATSDRGAYTTYSIESYNAGVLHTTSVDKDNETDTLVKVGTVAKEDKVLYYYGRDNFYMEAVDALTGKVTKATSGGEYTVGGEVYKLAAASKLLPGNDDITPNNDDDQSFFVDSFNNILAVKESAASPVQVVLVISFSSESVLEGSKIVTKYYADVVDLDGKVVTLPTKNYSDSAKDLLIGKVCSYVLTKGENIFTEVNINTGDPKYRIAYLDEIESEATNLSIATPTSLAAGVVNLASTTTKFVVVNYNDDDEVDGTVTVYAGRNKVPDFPNLSKTTAVSFKNDGDADAIAEIVYIFDKNASAKKEKLVFVLGSYGWDTNGYAVNVIKEGVPATIVVSSSSNRTWLTNLAGELLKEFRVTSGALDSSNMPVKVPDAEFEAIGKISIQNNGNLFMVNGAYKGFTIADDVPVYVIEVPGKKAADAEGEALTALNITDTAEYDDAKLYVVKDGSKITAVYVISYT